MSKEINTSFNREQIKRVAVIDKEVGEKRYPNKERLADRLGVSSKTIQRDLDFMRFQYEAPIEYDPARGGFYYSDPDFRLNPLKIDASEFLALAVTEKVLAQYKDSPYAKYFKNFYNKISNLFDGKLSIDAKVLDKILSFSVGPARPVDKNVMSAVEKGLKGYRILHVKYITGYTKKESEREIDAYHMKNHLGDWYLIGYCHLAKEIRIFALSRIKEIRLTQRHFDVPDSFNINEYFKDSFGIFESDKIYNVKLKVMNETVGYISEREWHKSQKITQQKDGSILIEFKVNNLTEILFWVLSMGKDCEVLQPKELRDAVKNELKEAMKNYKN